MGPRPRKFVCATQIHHFTTHSCWPPTPSPKCCIAGFLLARIHLGRTPSTRGLLPLRRIRLGSQLLLLQHQPGSHPSAAPSTQRLGTVSDVDGSACSWAGSGGGCRARLPTILLPAGSTRDVGGHTGSGGLAARSSRPVVVGTLRLHLGSGAAHGYNGSPGPGAGGGLGLRACCCLRSMVGVTLPLHDPVSSSPGSSAVVWLRSTKGQGAGV